MEVLAVFKRGKAPKRSTLKRDYQKKMSSRPVAPAEGFTMRMENKERQQRRRSREARKAARASKS